MTDYQKSIRRMKATVSFHVHGSMLTMRETLMGAMGYKLLPTRLLNVILINFRDWRRHCGCRPEKGGGRCLSKSKNTAKSSCPAQCTSRTDATNPVVRIYAAVALGHRFYCNGQGESSNAILRTTGTTERYSNDRARTRRVSKITNNGVESGAPKCSG